MIFKALVAGEVLISVVIFLGGLLDSDTLCPWWDWAHGL